MPLATCPTCATALRVPDGSAAAVRCPKCKTVFPPAPDPASPPAPPPSRPAFGSAARPAAPRSGVHPPDPPKAPARPPVVVAPPVPAPPRPPSRVVPKPPPAPEPEDEFEVMAEGPAPPPKKAVPRDGEDDRRPRKAVLLDDEDDRPRRVRLADDDEEDDRPRRGRRARGDDGGYDAPAGRNPFRPAAVGALLVAISYWLYLAVFGVLALLVLLTWAGRDAPEALAVVAGAAGLANWVVAGVGIGFLLAGPAAARGVTVAAAVLAGVVFVIMSVAAADIADADRLLAALGGGSGARFLYAYISLIPVLDLFVPVLAYSGKARAGGAIPGEFYVLALGGAVEVARLVVLTLAVGAAARAARDEGAAAQARTGVGVVAGVCGGAAAAVLVVVLIVVEGELARSGRHLLAATALLACVGYALMLILPALAAHAARDALGGRAEKVDRAARRR